MDLRIIPHLKYLRLASKGKLETFKPVWHCYYYPEHGTIVVKHGGTYGAWTVSCRSLDDIYQMTWEE